MSDCGWFQSRRLTPEIMDDPGLDAAEHERALRALRRINFLSASPGILWPAIWRLARERDAERLRVLDIATGSGDVPLALWRKARRVGLKLEILGLDVSRRAIDLARSQVDDATASVRFEQFDVLRDSLPDGYDVLTTSLFLHHLSDEEAGQLVGKMATAARQMVLISDLRRSRLGWWIAFAASRLLTRSKVLHVDALLSVQAAFTEEELLAMATATSLHDVKVERCWPCRMLLSGRV